MLHLPAQPLLEDAPLAYSEAVSRLAGVRHALRLVGPFAGGPASDIAEDEALAESWNRAGEHKQRLFDRRSDRMICAATAGIEALLMEREEGREPNEAASETLVEEIRRELREVAGIILG